MKVQIMEQLRKLRKLVNDENPVKNNLDFLNVMRDENYRHSMDYLDTASNELNKSCTKAKEIVEMQWWRRIKQQPLSAENKEKIIKELNDCKQKSQKYLRDFEEEIDNMIRKINESK